jgi:hypothetical protein
MKIRDLRVYRKLSFAVVGILIFFAGAFSSYIYLRSSGFTEVPSEIETDTSEDTRGYQTGKYAVASKAEDLIRSYLEPYDAELRQFFMDKHGTVYIDVSEELEKNFQGSLMDEYLVISGLLKNLSTHVPSVKAMRVLIEGRETDTLGGHISLMAPIETQMIGENIVLH